MKWFLMLIFAGGTAEMMPAGECKIECLVAAQEVTTTPMPVRWIRVMNGRRVVAASCLPFDAVADMMSTTGERLIKRPPASQTPKPERGPGGCA